MHPPYFAGYCGAGRREPVPRPHATRSVLDGDRRLWANHSVRVVSEGGWHAVISGTCAATDTDLRRRLGRIAADHEDIESLTGLGGSYHVVLDDGTALTAVGDRAGLRTLYTVSTPDMDAFASTPLALAALRRSQVDPAHLAAQLLCPEAIELSDDSSAFTGIRRVAPGWILRCGPEGLCQAPRRTLLVQSGFDGAPALRDALTRAVAARAAASLSVDLSGGLDSTSLAVLASTAHPHDLLAVTYIDPLAGADEDAAYAREAARHLDGVRHDIVKGGAATLPYAALDAADLTVFDQPGQEVLLSARTRVRLAPGLGCAAHLGGDGGDVVLAGGMTYLVDLARQHRYGALRREATGWAKLRHRPTAAVLGAAIRQARTSYAREVSQSAASLTAHARGIPLSVPRAAVEANLAWCRPAPAAAWSTPKAALEIAERLRALAAAALPDLNADAMAMRAVRRHGALTRDAQRQAASWGITLHAPYLDDPVVTACARVPVTERTTVAAAKPLLARALAGTVPAHLLARRSKGDYSAAEYAGLRAAGPWLRALLADSRLADLGLIAPERVLPVLEDAIAGARVRIGALAEIIATELWLHSEPHAAAYPWTGGK